MSSDRDKCISQLCSAIKLRLTVKFACRGESFYKEFDHYVVYYLSSDLTMLEGKASEGESVIDINLIDDLCILNKPFNPDPKFRSLPQEKYPHVICAIDRV